MSDEDEVQRQALQELLEMFSPTGAVTTVIATIIGMRSALVEQGFTVEQAQDIIAGLYRSINR